MQVSTLDSLKQISESVMIIDIFFSGAMLVVIFIFALLSIFYYEYRSYATLDPVGDDLDEDEKLNLKEEEKEMAAEILK